LRDFIVKSTFIFDKLSRSALFRGAEAGLHSAHLAYPYQLSPFVSPQLTNGAHLLLGVWQKKLPLRVLQTPERRELGNMAVIARTRGGKGLLAKAQILSWSGSIIINDIKGDLFDDTAGYRSTMSDVYVFDTRGVGHRYDPLAGKTTSGELRGIAKYLLLDADEKNRVFAERAIKMLTAILIAARMEGYPPLAYAAYLIHTGMKATVRRLEELSERSGLAPEDNLATRFLGEAQEEANFDSRFLDDAWATLSSKIEDIIEDSTLACVSGSDFTAKDIIAGERPKTIYFRWPERHVKTYAPLIQLVISTLFDDMCAIADDRKGKGCRPVLFMLDEAGRTPVADLPDFASTVAGRNISILVSYQSLAQPATIYGAGRAETLLDNMDSILFLRPPVGNRETAKAIEEICGEVSRFAHSETAYHGKNASEGKSEKAIPVLSAWDVKRMKDDEVVVLHRDVPPFQAQRVDWRNFPHLVERTHLPAPTLRPLPKAPKILPLAEDGGEPSDKFGPSD
jgi:type IV secretion system protein VirD4